MTAVRLIPLPIHAALRLTTGLLTMAAPFLAGFGVLATLLSIVVGAIVVGLSLSATPDERGLTPLPVTTLHALDWASVLALMVIAAAVSVHGDAVAGSVLLAIGAAQMAGNLTTRYSLRA
jgi:hypothetical protein